MWLKLTAATNETARKAFSQGEAGKNLRDCNLTKAETNTWCVNGDFCSIHKRMLMGGENKINLLHQSFSACLIIVKDLCLKNIFFSQLRFSSFLIPQSC